MSNATKAVESLINNFAPNATLANAIKEVFENDTDFLSKIILFDEQFNKHQSHEAIMEYAFDLMMAHHLELNNSDEDYFDSMEWQDIEDKTLERGTELLNILLYLNEANDTDTDINIEDFLYEFLLVDEDEFQDEHRIYEEIIANQELIEEPIGPISEVAKRLPDELEIRELFVPLLLLFKHAEDNTIPKEYASKLTKTELALLAALLDYANG